MKKKRALTLLEIVMVMFLLGILLTGLFNVFRQGLKKNIDAKMLKQNILQLELFHQRMRVLLSKHEKVWLEKHPDASSLALYVEFNQTADPDLNMCGDILGMIYVNHKKELCFASWGKNAKARIETLLDHVSALECRLFDAKKETWNTAWPSEKKELPVMAAMDLTWNGKKVPFVFFLSQSDEKIIYPLQP